jgi:putative DNA primase/helicase
MKESIQSKTKKRVISVIPVIPAPQADLEVTKHDSGNVINVIPESNDIPDSNVIPIKSDDPLAVGESERPCFRVLNKRYKAGKVSHKAGVYYLTSKPVKGDSPPMPVTTWVCAPLHIMAVTCDGFDNNFGRLLNFLTSNNKWRKWAMPSELLKGSGEEVRGELLYMGFDIHPNQHKVFSLYLQLNTPSDRVTCAASVGWIGDVFVLPDKAYGVDADKVIYQSIIAGRAGDEYARAGTLEGWRAGIAALAVGNPFLMLSLCASFSGPLLNRCNAEGGGLHFTGASSTGKTTLINAACSVWGGASHRRSWRATSNGMEGVAALFNDNLLALDEISECDPREVGAIIYSLGNGTGKQRAGRTGAARAVSKWACVIISSGERGIASSMGEAGKVAKAGQLVRLLDIPAGRAFGCWDELHGRANGAALSDDIRRAGLLHHGEVGRAYLERLTRDKRDFPTALRDWQALPQFNADDGEGQEKRAAARFALFGHAGEVATGYGLTGWQAGQATEAAAVCFALWRSERGAGNDERRQVTTQVSEFIDAHGDSRFSDIKYANDCKVLNRAGWWRLTDKLNKLNDDREYLFSSAGLREALKGIELKRGVEILHDCKALSDKKSSVVSVAGHGSQRLYCINVSKLDDGTSETIPPADTGLII